MSLRLADHLNAARRSHFIGRREELELFRAALLAGNTEFFVLYVFGPGGIGKTTLLNAFVNEAHQNNAAVHYLDARNIEATPDAFLSALRTKLGLDAAGDPVEALAGMPGRVVLLIDTYELLASLDDWVRESFLPQLAENILVVISGCDEPAPAWRQDSGWQFLVHELPLRNLSPDETRCYLTIRQVPADQQAAVVDFTHGHPLALSLIADAFAQRRNYVFQPEESTYIVKTLLDQFARKVPGPAHRAALEACALVRVMTEPLLAAMLKMDDSTLPAHSGAYELFDWLRGLSFIEARAGGLFPHDMARETLVTELQWRNPGWYAELHRRARHHYLRAFQQASGIEQHKLLLDLIFLHRHNPVVRHYFDWRVGNSHLAGLLRRTDVPQLTEMVARHEGARSAELAAYWFNHRAPSISVWRDEAGQPSGFLTTVPLHRTTPEDLAIDPGVHAAWKYLDQQAPLRRGEKATLFRFWLARDTYQSVSPIQSLIFVNAIMHDLTTPGLAYTFLTCAQPDFWEAPFAYANLQRLPAADFSTDGHRYGLFGHDWRTVPPVVWLDLLAQREIATIPMTDEPVLTVEPLVVLSKAEFREAVYDALRDYTRPNALRNSPLLRSRIVASAAGVDADEEQCIEVLRQQLRQAADLLTASPRQARLYEALDHFYFRATGTQEGVAEQLDVPFSTFRRHLKVGVVHVTETLWQWELNQGGS